MTIVRGYSWIPPSDASPITCPACGELYVVRCKDGEPFAFYCEVNHDWRGTVTVTVDDPPRITYQEARHDEGNAGGQSGHP